MYYNKLDISPVQCLRDWNLDFKHSGKELVIKCIFSDCDSYKQNARHLYMSEETGVYCCFKCGAKGNLITMAEHLGLTLYPVKQSKRLKVSSKKLIRILHD